MRHARSSTIGAVELFWVATAWPNGASTFVFVAIVLLLLSPRGDLAYGGAIAFSLGVAVCIVVAAIIKFAVLPAFETFPAFCVAIGLFLVPVGFAMARSRQPAAIAVFTAMSVNFMPLLAPTNQMSYDTAQFYNSALAIVAGCGVAALAFRLLPPLSPALRARRLLALTLRDLRRLAIAPAAAEHRRIGKAACTAGSRHCRTRPSRCSARNCSRRCRSAARSSSFATWLRALERPRSSTPRLRPSRRETARSQSRGCVNSIAASPPIPTPAPETAIALRARARILVISEALAEHASYFDAGAPA